MPPRGSFTRRDRAAIAAAIAAALPNAVSAADAPAGRVNFAIGKVLRTDSDGAVNKLRRGTVVNSGDTIKTERGGRVQIRFNDGAFTSLKPNTEFRIDDYAFEKKPGGRERSIFSLIRGGLRTITGLIGKRDRNSYQLRTRVATIGIRGTGFGADDNGDTVNLNVLNGLVEMCNGGGCVVGAPGAVMEFLSNSVPGVVQGDSSNSNNKTESEVVNNGLQGLANDELHPASQAAALRFTDSDRTDDEGNSPGLGGSLPSGPGYALALAFSDGDQVEGGFVNPLRAGDPVTAQFVGANSALVSYAGPSANVGTGSIGSSVVTEFGADGVIGWGRWTGGTTTGTGNVHPLSLGGAGFSLHYAIGKPTAAMPQAGTASFSLLGSTTPTLSSGEGNLALHKLNAATMNVDFTAASVNLDLDATAFVGGNTNRYVVNNMPLAISQVMGVNSHAFSGSGLHAIETNLGTTCNASSKCSVNVEGFFAGQNASRAGLNYRVNTGEASTAGPIDSVIGVVTLKDDAAGGE